MTGGTLDHDELEAAFVAFREGTLRPERFPHEAHMYVAWRLIHEHGAAEGARRFTDRLRRYVADWGRLEKYHETVTWALLHRIAAVARGEGASRWESFRSDNARLFDDARSELRLHYSDSALSQPAAKRRFVPPDREPLPALGKS